MKSGKVSDTVLNRSVLKDIQKVNHLQKVPRVGGGAAAISVYAQWHLENAEESIDLAFQESLIKGTEKSASGTDGGISRATQEEASFFSAIQTVINEGELTGYLAAVRAANQLAAKGAGAAFANIAVTIPETMDERELRKLLCRYNEFLTEQKIEILGGHTAVSESVTAPVATVQMFGVKRHKQKGVRRISSAVKTEENEAIRNDNEAKRNRADFANLDIVMTKSAGLLGTALLAKHFEEKLSEKLPKRFVERAKEMLSEAKESKEAYIVTESMENGSVPEKTDKETSFLSTKKISYVHAASGGGIFGALWELAEFADCGLQIDLPSIPIRQETVEICEYFDCNPYQLLTTGCFLILADNGGALCEQLKENGVTAKVIGRTTTGSERTVKTGDEIRFLEPNRIDEYERVRKQETKN